MSFTDVFWCGSTYFEIYFWGKAFVSEFPQHHPHTRGTSGKPGYLQYLLRSKINQST